MMRKIVILIISVGFLGCTTANEPAKTYTASEVTKENVLSFASVDVNVHPDLDYQISGHLKKDKSWDDPTKREFSIFTHPGMSKIVLIETHSRRLPNSFQASQDRLFKHKAVIQKGSKRLAGQTWEVYTRTFYEFPENVISAIKQKGIRMESYSCGMEMGVARELDRFSRIFISYIEGLRECQTLPQNGGYLNDAQIRLLQDFVSRFDETITISGRSEGMIPYRRQLTKISFKLRPRY
jgi:hypothetical protein